MSAIGSVFASSSIHWSFSSSSVFVSPVGSPASSPSFSSPLSPLSSVASRPFRILLCGSSSFCACRGGLLAWSSSACSVSFFSFLFSSSFPSSCAVSSSSSLCSCSSAWSSMRFGQPVASRRILCLLNVLTSSNPSIPPFLFISFVPLNSPVGLKGRSQSPGYCFISFFTFLYSSSTSILVQLRLFWCRRRAASPSSMRSVISFMKFFFSCGLNLLMRNFLSSSVARMGSSLSFAAFICLARSLLSHSSTSFVHAFQASRGVKSSTVFPLSSSFIAVAPTGCSSMLFSLTVGRPSSLFHACPFLCPPFDPADSLFALVGCRGCVPLSP